MVATIRHAEPTDAVAVAALLWRSRRQAMPWLIELHGEAETHAWVAEVLLESATVWVAAESGQIAGVAALAGSVLEQLYIAPEFQRQGIGTRLLATAMDAAGPRLSLYVFARNTSARRFYERHGFVAAEASDGARNEEGEPDVRYEWQRSSFPAEAS